MEGRSTVADPARAARGGRAKTGAARAALIAAAVVLGSRLLTFVVAYRASFLPHLRTVPLRWRFPRGAEVFHGFFGHLLNPGAHWDGVWFQRIASNGYADPHSPAFFPLYAVAVRGAGWLFGGGFELGGIVLSLVLALLLVPAGLVAWMAYLWQRTGDPLAFSQVQRAWGRAFAAAPLVVWQGVLEAVGGARRLLWTPPGAGHPLQSAYFPPTANLLGLPFLVVALGALVAGIRRLPVAYTGYAVVSLLFYLSFPVRGAPLLSLPRFVIVVFPLFVLGLVLLTSRFAAFTWVA